MAFTKRRDATYVRDLPALRRIIPYLMPTRTESLVYFPQRIEVDALLTWLEATNSGRPRDRARHAVPRLRHRDRAHRAAATRDEPLRRPAAAPTSTTRSASPSS